jgi:hypothetical protein
MTASGPYSIGYDGPTVCLFGPGLQPDGLPVCQKGLGESQARQLESLLNSAFAAALAQGEAERARLREALEAKVPPGHILDDTGTVRKVLGSLPMTADGCVVVAGATVYCPLGGECKNVCWDAYCLCKNGCYDEGCQGDSSSGTHWRFEKCYSTQALARTALEGSKP